MGFSQTIKKDSIWLKPILIFNIVILQLKQEAIHKAGGNSMNWIGL
jgi:hypothetical protein